MEELAIVTGGSRGIGERLVRSLLKEMPVLNISRTPLALPDRSLPGPRYPLHNLCVDLANVREAVYQVDRWLAIHPDYAISLFVSNAAALKLGWLHTLPLSEYESSLAINAFAPIQLTRTIKHLGRFNEAGARIIYVTSSLARNVPELSFAGIGLYSASKATLGRLAAVQRREFALTSPHLTVTQIHPGIVDTAMQSALRQDEGLDPAFAVKTRGLPHYRAGEWDDVAPETNMRTIDPDFAAQFILWVAEIPPASVEPEYDFYACRQFHCHPAY